jgi:hypothetical protein
MRHKSPSVTRSLAVLRLHAADQGRSGASGRPYLSAESCTHSAAGKSGSDSHRPKLSAMTKDPAPSAARADSKQGGREGRGALLALVLVLEAKLARLVEAFRCGSPDASLFRRFLFRFRVGDSWIWWLLAGAVGKYFCRNHPIKKL